MHANPTRRLSIGIDARALLDLRADDEVLLAHGRETYRRYELEKQGEALPAGPGLPVLQALLEASRGAEGDVEIVVVSESVADASLRVLSSARQHHLEVTRAAFTGGEPLAPYLEALRVDLFLSGDEEQAAAAMDSGTAAALVLAGAGDAEPRPAGLRIALDGGVIARCLESGDGGGDGQTGEVGVTRLPHASVPRWVGSLAGLQRIGGGKERLCRTALFSSEEASVREQILDALRRWEIGLDQAFFTEASSKGAVLAAFQPDISFGVLHRPDSAGHSEPDESPGEQGRFGRRPSRLRFRS